MKVIKQLSLLPISLFLISACSLLDGITSKKTESNTHYNPNVNFISQSEYTEPMSMDIKRDLKGGLIDNNLQRTSSLSYQLSEHFLTGLPSIGLLIADLKVSDFLNVTFDGDFSLLYCLKGIRSHYVS
jgi:hypothetical protein